jgi:hypothetical protein
MIETLTPFQAHDLAVATLPDSPANCRALRRFFIDAIDSSTDLHTQYRAYGWPMEQELMEKLVAFNQEDELAVHNLKLVRRFLLRRYSFCRVLKVDTLLRKKGVRFWWLCKDYIVPRIGLSLLLGFALVLGSSRLFDALRELATKRCVAGALIAVCGLLALSLIYLNVRETLGASHSAVARRTLGIFIAAILWAACELLVVYGLSLVMRHDFVWTWAFNWLHAAEIGAVALVVAILTQFFFTKAGSMAEPL